MTVATHPEPAAALRASFTCTWPRGPLMVPPRTLFAMVPRLPALAGAVIDSAPPVTVTVADVAAAVLFLLRDAKFTTGQIIKVDGGRSLAV